MSPRVLGWVVFLGIVGMTAGTPLLLPLAGRTLPLGPTDACVLLLAVTFPAWYRRLPPLTTAAVCALLFALWAWSSAVFWSIDFRRSVLNAKAFLEAGVIFMAVLHLDRDTASRTMSRAIRGLNLVLAVQILLLLARVARGTADTGYYGLKDLVALPLGGSNFLAIFLEFGLLYELLSRRRGWWLIALINAAAIVLTLSRGALLATGVTLGVASIVALGLRGQRRVSLVAIGALAGGAAIVTMTPALRVLVDAFQIIGRSAGGRLELWQDAWSAAAWRPLTGVGYGAYESIGTARDVHSLPLALLAETGVPGLLFFTLAVAGMLRSAMRVYHRAEGAPRSHALGIMAGAAVVLVHSLIEPFFTGFSMILAAAILGWTLLLEEHLGGAAAPAPAVLQVTPA